MSNEAIEARRQYYREWAAKNPDKVKAKNARFWQKRAERMREAKQEAKQNAEDAEV